MRKALIVGASSCCGCGFVLAFCVFATNAKHGIQDIQAIAVAVFASVPLLLLIPSRSTATPRARFVLICLIIFILLLFATMLSPEI